MAPNSNVPIAMADPPTLNILLVEDNHINQELMTALLKRRRHRVTVAQNGKEALDILESHAFDAILMDIQMPVMDGLEATRQIRAREEQNGGHVPIIAMTANTTPRDQELCVEAGMDDYVAKPVEINKLFTALQRIPAK